MAIEGVVQPEFIEIGEDLRLRKYDGVYDFTWDWYQDPELVYLVDGEREPYTWEQLAKMYGYLDRHGELYFIEVSEDGVFRPIGDVTFWAEDMPIVIGVPEYRGRGIGRRVIAALIERGRKLGYPELRVDVIYPYNHVSRKCFESLGFQAYHTDEDGSSYRLVLEDGDEKGQ